MKYFVRPTDTADYAYDFGDDWQHAVILEAKLELEQGEAGLACLAGEGACPPEDCGGIHGYQCLLEAINDPAHPEHSAIVEWVGDEFDPEGFAPNRVKFDDPGERWKRAFQNDGR